MKKLLIILLIGFLACNAPNQPYQDSEPVQKTESTAFKKGKRQLEIQGYKNITETAYPYSCCSEGDSWVLSTGFKAETPDGEIVEGCFCVKGIIRNSVTIRFK
jgi:hypothetical protein